MLVPLVSAQVKTAVLNRRPEAQETISWGLAVEVLATNFRSPITTFGGSLITLAIGERCSSFHDQDKSPISPSCCLFQPSPLTSAILRNATGALCPVT